eukprot:9503238-Pyramimonas_sp.AAC.2
MGSKYKSDEHKSLIKAAAREQNNYLVQKLARLLACRRRGPRQRRFAATPNSSKSARAWAHRMRLQPLSGGCQAIEKHPMQVKNEIDQEGRETMEESEAVYLAAEDWGLLSRAVWKLRFW